MADSAVRASSNVRMVPPCEGIPHAAARAVPVAVPAASSAPVVEGDTPGATNSAASTAAVSMPAHPMRRSAQ